MSTTAKALSAVTLGLYAMLLIAMGIAPDALGARVAVGSGWTWMLVAVIALFVVQVGAVIAFAATVGDEAA